MDKEQIKSEYEQLCREAERHNFNYYVLDNPTIEDDEYDKLMRRIKEIEAENPELVSEKSPTQHVGGYAINTFEKVTHEVQMGSLQDVFSKGELYEFDENVIPFLLFNMAVRNIKCIVYHSDVLKQEIYHVYRIDTGKEFGTFTEVTK